MFKVGDRVQHKTHPQAIGTIVANTLGVGVHSPHAGLSVSTEKTIKVIWDEERFNKRADFNKPFSAKSLELYEE